MRNITSIRTTVCKSQGLIWWLFSWALRVTRTCYVPGKRTPALASWVAIPHLCQVDRSRFSTIVRVTIHVKYLQLWQHRLWSSLGRRSTQVAWIIPSFPQRTEGQIGCIPSSLFLTRWHRILDPLWSLIEISYTVAGRYARCQHMRH